MDYYKSRGSQDHRTIRQIEQPLFNKQFYTSKENIKEVYKRIKYKRKRHINPLNNTYLTKEQFNEYFKFTIVRNPWERSYSWYKNVIRDETHLKNHQVSNEITFNDFIKLYAGKGMLRPQLYWLKDFRGEINFDLIGRFETLNKDFKLISEKLNLASVVLPHKLKGSTFDYKSQFTKESIDLIAKIYKEEIKLFDYSF